MVFEVRDLWPELPIAIGALPNPLMRAAARRLERFAYRQSHHIVALSPGMKDGVVKTGFPEERVDVIPNSADLELFDPKTTDASAFRAAHPEIGDAPLVVYAGTLGRINGVDYLPRIAAAAKELGARVRFVVAGRGQQEEQVRAGASELGVFNDNFFMLPPLPKRQVPNLLAAADLALSLFIDMKPMWANSANKFFDALASGTPVAINYGGWQADLLRETEAGIVMPPNDPDTAAAQIIEFISNREAVKCAGHAARQLAEDQFDRDQLADRLESVLRATAEGA